MTHPRDELHPAVRAGQDLRAIVDAWPDLTDALAVSGEVSRGERVKGSPRRGLVINADVSEVMRDVTEWALFLARVLCDETDWQPPADHRAPVMLTAIRWRIGHFTAHPDPLMVLAFMDDCEAKRAKVESAAYPTGARWVPTKVPCLDHGDDPQGRRVPCVGEYRVLLRPDIDMLGDMVCSRDKTHRVTPAQWQRLERRRPADPAMARRLLEAIRGATA